MKGTSGKNTNGRRKVERESVGKLTVREITEKKDGYKWKTFLVQGWTEADGRHGRKKFKTPEDAKTFIAVKEVELMNAQTTLHNVVTRLSQEQVEEAEAAFTRLEGRHPLGQAVDYFLSHFAQPAEPKALDSALDAFLDAREEEDTRPRSLVQLRSTLGRFIGFATLHLLPAQLRPEIERVRAEIEKERQAKPKEIVRHLGPAIREAGRRAAEDADDVVSMLSGKLDPALREAVAAARDAIEKRRKATDSEIAAALVASVEGARVSAVHEVETPLVVEFLKSLRAKDGKSKAGKKTWNNFRADLHNFFGWCAKPQRRWCLENCVAAVNKFTLGRGKPNVLTVGQARELMAYVADYKGGAMAPYFAHALFAGLRTDPDGELRKLAKHPDRANLIDLAHGVIHVLPEISKTGDYRETKIRPNYREWLIRFPGPIWPRGADRMLKHIRARFHLTHDELRNSFFSYLVAAEKSVANAALEGGNTEAILRKFYLNLANTAEAQEFWRIVP